MIVDKHNLNLEQPGVLPHPEGLSGGEAETEQISGQESAAAEVWQGSESEGGKTESVFNEPPKAATAVVASQKGKTEVSVQPAEGKPAPGNEAGKQILEDLLRNKVSYDDIEVLASKGSKNDGSMASDIMEALKDREP